MTTNSPIAGIITGHPRRTASLPPPPHNLTFYGDAHFRNDAIALTPDHPCFYSSSSTFGRALYFRPFRFLDPRPTPPLLSLPASYSPSSSPLSVLPRTASPS
ncbi:L-type lectin-domain containing receptor kinase S.6 [Linum grandiflorum]